MTRKHDEVVGSRSDARSYYDDFSRRYDRGRDRESYHQMLDDLELDILQPYAEQGRVLEVGCGTGRLLKPVENVSRLAVGLDLSPGMLALARKRGLQVVQGSALQMPFRDACFDLVYSFKVFPHVPDLRSALEEANRVLRPGGHLVFEVYNPLSIRYVSKLIAGPKRIGLNHTERDIYTRWDLPWKVSRSFPSDAVLVETRGVRIVTPFAGLHRLPGVGRCLRAVEQRLSGSALRLFAGFYVVVLRKVALRDSERIK
ncbi:MAG: class I SAM-dependent methyltransferase [Myxococcota bacterium]